MGARKLVFAGFTGHLHSAGLGIHLECQGKIFKGFEDVQEHFGGNGDGPFFLCGNLDRSGHGRLEVACANGRLSWSHFKQEVVEDGQSVAAVEHTADGLKLAEQGGAGDDELHSCVMGLENTCALFVFGRIAPALFHNGCTG